MRERVQMSGKLKVAEEEVVDLAEFFKVFGDPTRLKILFVLEEGESDVTSLCQELSLQQSTVSQQLKLLRARRLVKWRKEGRNVLYRLNDEHIQRILALGSEHYEEMQ
jgi:DNA-binding transcriptional ArsR family regulator